MDSEFLAGRKRASLSEVLQATSEAGTQEADSSCINTTYDNESTRNMEVTCVQ